MNTCYCTRLPQPHTRTPQCGSYRIDCMIRRREMERRLDEEFELDDDADYIRQDHGVKNVWRKV